MTMLKFSADASIFNAKAAEGKKENLLSKQYRHHKYNLIPSSVPIVKLIRYLNSFTSSQNTHIEKYSNSK